MPPRGYTSLQRLERRLGQSLTGKLAQEAQALIEAAESWVDQRTGSVWLEDGTVRVEAYDPARVIQLRTRPVASVSLVRTRHLGLSTDWTTLDTTNYELIDATRGKLLLSPYWGLRTSYLRVIEVTYTPVIVSTVDERVALATTDLVAFWLKGRLPGDGGITGDIQSYRIGDDLQVTLRQGSMVLGVPDSIVHVLDTLGGRKLAFA